MFIIPPEFINNKSEDFIDTYNKNILSIDDLESDEYIVKIKYDELINHFNLQDDMKIIFNNYYNNIIIDSEINNEDKYSNDNDENNDNNENIDNNNKDNDIYNGEEYIDINNTIENKKNELNSFNSMYVQDLAKPNNFKDMLLRSKNNLINSAINYPPNCTVCNFWNFIGIKTNNTELNIGASYSYITVVGNKLEKQNLIDKVRRLIPSNYDSESIVKDCSNFTIEELNKYVFTLETANNKETIDRLTNLILSMVGGFLENKFNKPKIIGNGKFFIPSLIGFKSLLCQMVLSSSTYNYLANCTNNYINTPSKTQSGINFRKDVFMSIMRILLLMFNNYSSEKNMIEAEKLQAEKSYTYENLLCKEGNEDVRDLYDLSNINFDTIDDDYQNNDNNDDNFMMSKF